MNWLLFDVSIGTWASVGGGVCTDLDGARRSPSQEETEAEAATGAGLLAVREDAAEEVHGLFKTIELARRVRGGALGELREEDVANLDRALVALPERLLLIAAGRPTPPIERRGGHEETPPPKAKVGARVRHYSTRGYGRILEIEGPYPGGSYEYLIVRERTEWSKTYYWAGYHFQIADWLGEP